MYANPQHRSRGSYSLHQKGFRKGANLAAMYTAISYA